MIKPTLSIITSHKPTEEQVSGLLASYELRKTGEAEWTITRPSSGTRIAVSLQEGKVLDLTIWRLLLIFDAEHRGEVGQIMGSISKKLQALSPDPQAVEFHTSDLAHLTATWPERANDSSI
jgi:hypothetical protein